MAMVRDDSHAKSSDGEILSSRDERGAPPGDQIMSAIRGLDPEDKRSIRVLVVDDDHALCRSCKSVLESEGYDVEATERGKEALDLLRREHFDIVLLDLYMSGASGSELLKERLDRFPETLVIIMTGNPSVETSVDVLRRGAWSYLPKPFSATHLQVLMGRAAHTVLVARESRKEAEAAKDRVPVETEQKDELTILGASNTFREVIDLAEKVARTDASVFIVGESGVGKDLVAQYIHQHSRRSSASYVPVNCAALPENLLESEMFGHVKGSFTGAVRDKPGLLEEAHGGTLFLDELTSMPTPIQAKLLRVLQDGVVRRVGATKADSVVNVRFISATNQDPAEAIEEGTLRTDVYYRLGVVPIEIPPLRARPEDIATLARHFLTAYWRKHRHASGEAPTLTDEALRALERHPWPGNVRELRNTIEHAVVLLEPGARIRPDDIPFIRDGVVEATVGDGNGVGGGGTSQGIRRWSSPSGGSLSTDGPLFNPEREFAETRDEHMAEWERQYLIEAVRWGGGNISKTARAMGIHRTYLYRLLDKHDLDHAEIGRRNGEGDAE